MQRNGGMMQRNTEMSVDGEREGGSPAYRACTEGGARGSDSILTGRLRKSTAAGAVAPTSADCLGAGGFLLRRLGTIRRPPRRLGAAALRHHRTEIKDACSHH